MKTSDDQLMVIREEAGQRRSWTEKKFQSTSQSQTCTKRRSWSLFGGLRPVWSTAAFWIPAKPLHLRTMLSKLMRCTENCNAWSWHWSTERARFCTTIPNCSYRTNACFKSHMNWTMKVLPPLPYSPDLSPIPTAYYFSKHLDNFFSQGKCFNNQQEAESIFQEFIKSTSTAFYTTGISKLICYCKKYVDCNGSYFD